MIGNSDSNRSEGQGGSREGPSTKEVCSKGTTVGTRNGYEARYEAMSVRGNTKSKGHRKAYLVEPCGTGRKFMHLTRGGLRIERYAEVSRGHSSEEACGNTGRAKGRRTKREQSTNRLAARRRVGGRNNQGIATAAVSLIGSCERAGGFLQRVQGYVYRVLAVAKGGVR